MVEVIIDEDSMMAVNKKIEEELKLMRDTKFTFNKKKLAEIGRNKTPFYLLKERKKDELTEQIEKHLESFKMMVMSAV